MHGLCIFLAFPKAPVKKSPFDKKGVSASCMCKGDLEMGLLSRACGLSQQNQDQQNQNSLPNKTEKKLLDVARLVGTWNTSIPKIFETLQEDSGRLDWEF